MGGTTAHHEHDAADETFQQAFGDKDRAELLQEDHDAWESVTGLLLTIVTIGVLFFAMVVCVITVVM